MNIELPKLSDRAILVKLTIKRAPLVKRNNVLTNALRMQENDASLTVLTELFKSKNSPIQQIKSAVNEVYAFHRTNTSPFVDAGPRVILNDPYFNRYVPGIKQLIAKKDDLMARHMPLYDQYVQDDISHRRLASQAVGRMSPASVADYPSRDEFEASMSIEFRPSPMPDKRHFMFDLSDEDLAKLDSTEQEIIATVQQDAVQRMMAPLKSLADRLGEYKGEKGERFHSSLIANLIEGCDLARQLTPFPTPEFLAEIDELKSTAKKCLDNVEVIKGSSLARDSARAKLDEVAKKMAAFM